jgi:hypothetical protein
MFVTLFFASAFSTRLIASLIYSFYIAGVILYFIIHKSSIQRLQTLALGLIDSIAALSLAYAIAMLTITSLKK